MCFIKPLDANHDKYIPQMIDKVTFKLSYESNLKDKVIVPNGKEPIYIQRSGCDDLKIPIIIEFKDNIHTPITICHQLSFANGGIIRKFMVDVSKKQFEEIRKRQNSDKSKSAFGPPLKNNSS